MTKEELLEKAKTSKLTKTELRDLLIYLCKTKGENIDLTSLDFSNIDGDVFISYMKVKGNLWQHRQIVQGDLIQYHQNVEGNLYQTGEVMPDNIELGFKLKKEEK